MYRRVTGRRRGPESGLGGWLGHRTDTDTTTDTTNHELKGWELLTQLCKRMNNMQRAN